MKIRGYRIEFGEIESAISSYSAVKQSVVLAKEHTNLEGISTGNKYLVSYYVSDEEFEKIKAVLPQFEDTNTLKPIYEALNGEIEYGIIRMTLTYLEM